jgi:glycosyltransferase involved in cell wall biosynthesis
MRTFYFTYAEPPSGVYSSQVIDVVQYINKTQGTKIQLVAFLSLHNFNATKANLQQQFPGAIVLPMLPKAHILGFNTLMLWLLCLLKRPQVIIARNVVATTMALKVKSFSSIQKICFDGRGAIAAEWHEYNVGVHPKWKAAIEAWEKKAVMKSDFRIAVSEKLVTYWTNKYGYTGSEYVVIPCTLNSRFRPMSANSESRLLAREGLEFSSEDILLAYSGSTAGWQSFSLLREALAGLLAQGSHIKILFLSPEDENISRLEKEYPGRINRRWVKHHDVPATLAACDYGILIREESVTNEVASPTKFAEYLSAGLPVIASAKIGDYSDFIIHNRCGFLLSKNTSIPKLEIATPDERNRLIQLVQTSFTKAAHQASYSRLMTTLEN